jgi:hypothetical protein
MIKIRWRKLDPEHVRRYTFHERAIHLIVAVTCVYLVFSGLALHTPYLFWMSSVLGGSALNPLLTRYIELVSLQARLSSVLIGTLDLPHRDSDRALLCYFNGDALRPLLALAALEVSAKGQMKPPSESLDLLEDLWNQVEEFQYPRDFGSLCHRACRLAAQGDGNNT